MRDILIIYSSTDGHTKKISNHIRSILVKKKDVDVISIDNISEVDITSYNSLIIGASVRYGGHSKKIINFIRNNSKLFDEQYTSFFSVNATARKTGKNTPEKNPYVVKLLEATSWKPTRSQVFAGKIDYPNYRFYDKFIIRFIMFLTSGPTNINTSHEFTNWDQVNDYAMNIIKDIED